MTYATRGSCGRSLRDRWPWRRTGSVFADRGIHAVL